MPYYEHVFIARQDISSAQVDTLVESFTGLIENDGGKVVNTEYWGLKNLAYRIKKNRKGHYVLFNLDAPVAAVNELERNERLHEDVLRYLTLRLDELPEGPSVMARGRKERGGRDRDDEYRARDRDRGDRDRGGDRGGDDAKPAAEEPAAAETSEPAEETSE